MRIERVRTGEPSGAIRISRRDFLKIGGTGLAGAALLGTVGCGVFQQQGGGQQGGGGGENQEVLNNYISGDIADLNSTTTTDTLSFDVLINTNEGLYRLDENEKPVPAQAEGVNVSDDKLAYTFTLRDGIKWSNGEPVTSQDFKYAWLKAMNPDTAGQYSFIISEYIEGGPEFAAGEGSAEDVAIETPDDKTLEVTLTRPTPFFLGLTAFVTYLPQNQEFVEQQGDKYAQSADALLYNGPYTLSEFNPSNKVVFDKNQDYWDAENVDIEKINSPIVKELQTALNLYQAGEVDLVRLEGEDVRRFKDSKEFFKSPEFSTFYLMLNQEDPAMANINIRKAIQRAIDRESYVNTLLAGGSAPAEGLVPLGMAGVGDQTFREAAGDVMPEYNSQEAKQLWDRGVQELGQEPTLELMAQDGSVAQEEATFIQNQLKENLGAEVKITVKPFDAFLEANRTGDYQMSGSGWGADYNDAMTFLDMWTTDSPFNEVNWSNERYDQLIADAKEEQDPQRRLDMLVEAEKLLIEEMAVLSPNYHRERVRLKKDYVSEVVFHPYGPELDYKYWEIST